MGSCWSCFRSPKSNKQPVVGIVDPARSTVEAKNEEQEEEQDDQLHPAVIEMANFRNNNETTKKKKKSSTKIKRKPSLQSTIIREHDSTFHSGAGVVEKPPARQRRPSTGRLSPIKLKTQRNVNPLSIRIRNEHDNFTTESSKQHHSKQTASDTALANFQKLKLQVEVAKKHQKRQQKVQEMEEEIKEADKYNHLWNQYESIQQKTTTATVEYDLKDVVTKSRSTKRRRFLNTSGGASVRSFLSQTSRRSRNSAHTDSGFRSTTKSSFNKRRTSKKDKKKTEEHRKRSDSSSFDLNETQTWYFDFDGLSPSSRKSNGSTCGSRKSQANLSLLSESSMAVQRRLYEEKRRQRKQRNSRRTEQQQHITDAPDDCLSETSSQREDYGPARIRRRPSQESLCTDDFSFTDMEVVAPLNNSFISDIDNDDSLSYLSLNSNDFGPTGEIATAYDHEAVVKQRLDIEAQLRALQASDDEEDEQDKTPAKTSAVDATLLEKQPRGGVDPPATVQSTEKVEDESTQRITAVVEKSPTGSPSRRFATDPVVANNVPVDCLPKDEKESIDNTMVVVVPPSGSPLRSFQDTSPTISLKGVQEQGTIDANHSDAIGSEEASEHSLQLLNGEGTLDGEGRDKAVASGKKISKEKEKQPLEPMINLEDSKARLTRKLGSVVKICPIDSVARLIEKRPNIVLSPPPERKSNLRQRLEQTVGFSQELGPTLHVRQPLDESIASEEESQLFRIPYSHKSPEYGALEVHGYQSDSLLVNRSVDDSSVDHQSVESGSTGALAQPRVLLSSLQSPTSVLDARETLEIAEKVEAHVHDVLHRYRSDDADFFHN